VLWGAARSLGVVGLLVVAGVAVCGFLFIRRRAGSTQQLVQEDKPLLDAEEFY
jgi:hypothetical protein